MNNVKIKSALISVFSKEGIAPIVAELVENKVKLYSTGGTYKYISKLGYDVIEVESWKELTKGMNHSMPTADMKTRYVAAGSLQTQVAEPTPTPSGGVGGANARRDRAPSSDTVRHVACDWDASSQ